MSARRPLILAGVRTPFARSGGVLASWHAEDLGARVVRELLLTTGVDPARLEALVCGNVGQQSRAANVARVIAWRAGIPEEIPAMTVHRNCASGFEAVVQCAEALRADRGDLFIAVGCESMSDYPLTFNDRARRFFARLQKARSAPARARALAGFRPGMLAPKVALLEGLKDPLVGLGMGETAEILAREWDIDRAAQDAFAARSHQRALEARDFLAGELCDVVTETGVLSVDDGVREDSTPERLARLRAVFARHHGSVTAGNSSQITDGAVALLIGTEAMAEALALEPLGWLEDHAWAALDPARMGLGPVHAMDRLFPDVARPFDAVDLIEINEAFAVQVLACLAAANDPAYCRRHFDRPAPLGAIPEDRLNVNGGAIALGHPVGASGARLVLTALRELARRDARTALVTLCVGGGQGGALLLRR